MRRIAPTEPVAQRAMRKIGWRILPLVFIIYVIAFLDQANVAYAKLTMSTNLGFSEAVYSFGGGLFFLGYILLEIPGALIVEKWGGRRWFARILITWGVCAVLLGFVNTPRQFYGARFLLGVARGGIGSRNRGVPQSVVSNLVPRSCHGDIFHGFQHRDGDRWSDLRLDFAAQLAWTTRLAVGFHFGGPPGDCHGAL
jgi:sugar phosphate permease